MEYPFCDVIGCGNKAAWQLMPSDEIDPDAPLLEEYLCDDHHKELACLHAELASLYAPLPLKTH